MGAFPESSLDSMLGDALPAVVDANVLRHDIGYVCRTGQRTALLAATNARIFRLYCAQHVYDEIEKHAAEWAASMKLEPDAFLTVWRKNYVPLLRLARTEGMETLLLSDERARVERLRLVLDIDDVPSAMLALTMRGFFLSEDAAPHETVHGRKLSAEERRAWLPIVCAGADSGELQRLVYLTGVIPVLVTWGGVALARSLWARTPALLYAAALIALFLATRVRRDQYQAVWRGTLATMSVLGTHVYQPQYEALDRFRSAAPVSITG